MTTPAWTLSFPSWASHGRQSRTNTAASHGGWRIAPARSWWRTVLDVIGVLDLIAAAVPGCQTLAPPAGSQQVAVAFSPDGRTLATVGWGDGRTYLWDVATGRLIATFAGGHIYDRGVDGSECRWARILAYEPPEIASILERSPAATRQLASRARRRVRGAPPPRPVDLDRQRRVAGAFLTALREGDFDALITVLDPDVVLRDDSAGLPGGAAVMHGARPVGAYALRYKRAARFVRPALVDGAAGLAIVAFGRLIGALRFTVQHDKITEIQMLSDRRRLRHVDLALSIGGVRAPKGRPPPQTGSPGR